MQFAKAVDRYDARNIGIENSKIYSIQTIDDILFFSLLRLINIYIYIYTLNVDFEMSIDAFSTKP